MSDRLFFTVITVNDELNAYKVFETLNARGVRLSATDLLKNYLFSVVHREDEHGHELDNLDERWERIVGRLGAESFPDFLRMHWISRRNFVRQTELFKTIRGEVRSRQQAFALVAGMDEDVDTYLALTSPDASGWSGVAKEQARLLRMFGVRQPYPLILAAKLHLTDSDFENLLRALVVISFRYNVIGNLQAADQERAYHAEASRVSKNEHTVLQAVLDSLRAVYPSDDAFRAAFAEKSITTTQARNRKIVAYLLCELERVASGVDADFESPTITIEHICPIRPDRGWDSFSEEEIQSLSSRLGNMTLLAPGKNHELGNAEYEQKRRVYADSAYSITREIAESTESWTPERVAFRQREMARKATAIWRIAQLS